MYLYCGANFPLIACSLPLVYIGLCDVHVCMLLYRYSKPLYSSMLKDASLINLLTPCLSLCAGNALRSSLKVRPNCQDLMLDQIRMKRTSFMPTRITRKMKGLGLIYPSRTRNSRTRLTKFTCMSTTLIEWRYWFSLLSISHPVVLCRKHTLADDKANLKDLQERFLKGS